MWVTPYDPIRVILSTADCIEHHRCTGIFALVLIAFVRVRVQDSRPTAARILTTQLYAIGRKTSDKCDKTETLRIDDTAVDRFKDYTMITIHRSLVIIICLRVEIVELYLFKLNFIGTLSETRYLPRIGCSRSGDGCFCVILVYFLFFVLSITACSAFSFPPPPTLLSFSLST
jgi:hypothetical protein